MRNSTAFDQQRGMNEKRRIVHLVRERCPSAKVLELFTVASGKVLDDADDWLQVPTGVPPELADRVNALAKKKR